MGVTLWLCQNSYWTWPIEIVSFPIKQLWFSIVMLIYQRVYGCCWSLSWYDSEVGGNKYCKSTSTRVYCGYIHSFMSLEANKHSWWALLQVHVWPFGDQMISDGYFVVIQQLEIWICWLFMGWPSGKLTVCYGTYPFIPRKTCLNTTVRSSWFHMYLCVSMHDLLTYIYLLNHDDFSLCFSLSLAWSPETNFLWWCDVPLWLPSSQLFW